MNANIPDKPPTIAFKPAIASPLQALLGPVYAVIIAIESDGTVSDLCKSSGIRYPRTFERFVDQTMADPPW